MSHRGRGGWTPGASEGSEILGQVVVGGGQKWVLCKQGMDRPWKSLLHTTRGISPQASLVLLAPPFPSQRDLMLFTLSTSSS